MTLSHAIPNHQPVLPAVSNAAALARSGIQALSLSDSGYANPKPQDLTPFQRPDRGSFGDGGGGIPSGGDDTPFDSPLKIPEPDCATLQAEMDSINDRISTEVARAENARQMVDHGHELYDQNDRLFAADVEAAFVAEIDGVISEASGLAGHVWGVLTDIVPTAFDFANGNYGEAVLSVYGMVAPIGRHSSRLGIRVLSRAAPVAGQIYLAGKILTPAMLNQNERFQHAAADLFYGRQEVGSAEYAVDYFRQNLSEIKQQYDSMGCE